MLVSVCDEFVEPFGHNVVDVNLARDHGIEILEPAFHACQLRKCHITSCLPAMNASTTSLNSWSSYAKQHLIVISFNRNGKKGICIYTTSVFPHKNILAYSGLQVSQTTSRHSYKHPYI